LILSIGKKTNIRVFISGNAKFLLTFPFRHRKCGRNIYRSISALGSWDQLQKRGIRNEKKRKVGGVREGKA